MKVVADLHIHSKYSRATSKQMDLSHIAESALRKGINIVGTGDFTHPTWLNELRLNLKEDGSGLLTYHPPAGGEKIKFILTAEISSIYKQDGKTRRVHTLLIVPDLPTAIKIHQKLAERGANLYSDGRPIIGISAKDLAQIVLEINSKSLVIPAHAWTPWFSVFGSKSGFDSLEECYGEIASEIFAIETGLSSDPQMNWRISALDNIALISNSDAHSPANLGREANVFDLDELTYDSLYKAIKDKHYSKFLYTIEFYPEEGMYHFDGHRSCNLVIDPFKKKYPDNLCPLCNKPLTIGVANRVEKLADRKESMRPKNAPSYIKIVPLNEIIANAFKVGKNSKKVLAEYNKLIYEVGNEFEILIDLKEDELIQKMDPLIVEGILNVRSGNISIEPGYDGVYGKVKILSDQKFSTQSSLF